MTRIKQTYLEKIVPALKDEFKYKSVMQVPKLEKVVLNMGLGMAVNDIKTIDFAVKEMTAISGQKPVVTKSKNAISNFKLKVDYPIGCKVTLRKSRMYEFIDRLINVSLPSVRDFRGVSHKGFDGNGNYTLGIKEHLIFPEIEYDKIDRIKGLNITIVTTAKTNEEGKALLKKLGMPFRQ